MYKMTLIAMAVASVALPALAATSPLGVDTSKAGSTKAQHMAFFDKMSKAERAKVTGNCKTHWSTLDKADQGFCKDIGA